MVCWVLTKHLVYFGGFVVGVVHLHNVQVNTAK